MSVPSEPLRAVMMITVNGQQFIIGHATPPEGMSHDEFADKIGYVNQELDEYCKRELDLLRPRLAALIPGMLESRGLDFSPAAVEGRQS